MNQVYVYENDKSCYDKDGKLWDRRREKL